MATINKNLKDQRRAELIIPYVPSEPKSEESQNLSETISTALPMAAMFTRHRMIGWSSVVFAVQQWLNETPGPSSSNKQPALFGVGMALLGLAITYMPILFPTPVRGAAPPVAV